jgi:hypothetical protein
MDNGRSLHSLIPLADFKAVLGIDDREDVLGRYCLITATYTIEQYCKRRLLRKKGFEFLPFYRDYIFPPAGLSGTGNFSGLPNPRLERSNHCGT